MVLPVILFLVGLVCLVKGGDCFVDGATGIAQSLHMPELLIGATIVSIGTTIPEVMVSATGAIQGSSAMAYGNAIGSIICNTSLIAAITLAFRPGTVEKTSIRTPLIFFFVSAILFAAVAYTTGSFSRVIGIILLLMFAAYITLSVRQAKKAAVPETLKEKTGESKGHTVKDILLLIVGAAVIAVGADLLVNNGTLIAQALGVPESVIALTFVALGTSLPELVTAITALIKGHSDLSVGNVIGANLFNLVLVSGIAITIRPFSLSDAVEKLIGGMNSSLLVDLPILFAVMLLLAIPAMRKGKLYRAQGIILLVIYAAYLIFQFFL